MPGWSVGAEVADRRKRVPAYRRLQRRAPMLVLGVPFDEELARHVKSTNESARLPEFRSKKRALQLRYCFPIGGQLATGLYTATPYIRCRFEAR